jgi:hypothetical protein
MPHDFQMPLLRPPDDIRSAPLFWEEWNRDEPAPPQSFVHFLPYTQGRAICTQGKLKTLVNANGEAQNRRNITSKHFLNK